MCFFHGVLNIHEFDIFAKTGSYLGFVGMFLAERERERERERETTLTIQINKLLQTFGSLSGFSRQVFFPINQQSCDVSTLYFKAACSCVVNFHFDKYLKI